MLDQNLRTAILQLHEKHHSIRAIARALKVSRGAVRDVIKSGDQHVPVIERDQKAAAYHDEIVRLNQECKSNLVRVHEELVGQGATLSYPALTAYCRRANIGYEPSLPSGKYHFDPGEEMQHDTSPHQVPMGDQCVSGQTASVVLCNSRMLFFQIYPRFRRFECKLVLDDAAKYFNGVCKRCMIDNTHVVVLRGTGADMVPVPEMESFSERYGFEFRAHEKGDANRSARVESPFHTIENNFLAGRKFSDWKDVNARARIWCDEYNAKYSNKLHASRRDLFATELSHLKPLPIWVPDVYLIHHRIVDAGGYIQLDTNHYSVPYQLIGRQMEVRETRNRVEVFDGPRKVACHDRIWDSNQRWSTLREHRPARGQGQRKDGVSEEEKQLMAIDGRLVDYISGLKLHHRGSAVYPLKRLLRLVRDYPRDPLLTAIHTAGRYGLYDMDRLERMILRQIATDYFVTPIGCTDEEHPHER